MDKGKIGILTWHHYDNFGSALQAYALQTFLVNCGYTVEIINYRKVPKIEEIKIIIKYVLGKLFSLLRTNVNKSYGFEVFRTDYLFETKVFTEKSIIGQYCNRYQCVICGSDQIWAPNVFDPIYMLDFVPDEIPKISYAASIGLNEIPCDLVETYKRLLTRFRAISVREKTGSALLEQACGIKSEVVLDPTLLINVECWKKIERKIKRNDKYIFCYFLNKNHKYKVAVQSYAKRTSTEVIGCSSNPEDKDWMTVLGANAGPREFLWLIHHADTVFTDSYHGTIFSLLYHKKFITFERFESTDRICQNSRIYQLADFFEISQRIIRITKDTEILIDNYDYSIFEQRLKGLREKSKNYLQKALEV